MIFKCLSSPPPEFSDAQFRTSVRPLYVCTQRFRCLHDNSKVLERSAPFLVDTLRTLGPGQQEFAFGCCSSIQSIGIWDRHQSNSLSFAAGSMLFDIGVIYGGYEVYRYPHFLD